MDMAALHKIIASGENSRTQFKGEVAVADALAAEMVAWNKSHHASQHVHGHMRAMKKAPQHAKLHVKPKKGKS